MWYLYPFGTTRLRHQWRQVGIWESLPMPCTSPPPPPPHPTPRSHWIESWLYRTGLRPQLYIHLTYKDLLGVSRSFTWSSAIHFLLSSPLIPLASFRFFSCMPCTLSPSPLPATITTTGLSHVPSLYFVCYMPAHPSGLSSVVTSLGKLSVTP